MKINKCAFCEYSYFEENGDLLCFQTGEVLATLNYTAPVHEAGCSGFVQYIPKYSVDVDETEVHECATCKWYDTVYGCPEMRINDKCIMHTPYTDAEREWH